jgi:malate dehydrogenase (quinone)
MTRMMHGTDVNFGALASKLTHWLGKQEGCGFASSHRVTDIKKKDGRWDLKIKDLKSNRQFSNRAKFVFIGGGGGTLPLLQKAGIPEAKGIGGFPIGGQWLISEEPHLVEQHNAKVYGMSPGAAPTMAVPHLDTRIIDGKKALLFRWDNMASLIKVGLSNIPLVRYLIQQGTQSMKTRMGELRNFYPDAKTEDWHLIDAGIRVQAIKKEDGDAGIVHFGTEVITDKDCSLSALLGASPGASVSTKIILEVIQKCFAETLATEAGHERMKRIIPSYDEDLTKAGMQARQAELNDAALQALQLI